MGATALELFANKADSVEVYAHSKLFVFFLHFLVSSALLIMRLIIESECKYDVCADLSGMKLNIKASQLNSMITVEEAMEIEKMISTIMIVMPSALGIPGVPDIFNFGHCFGLFLINLFNKIFVHFLAVSRSSWLYLQSLIE